MRGEDGGGASWWRDDEIITNTNVLCSQKSPLSAKAELRVLCGRSLLPFGEKENGGRIRTAASSSLARAEDLQNQGLFDSDAGGL